MKKNPAVNVVVNQEEEAPVDAEILASAIIKLDAAAQRILASGLRQHAIVVLLNDLTKVGKPDIRNVLDGLSQLRKRYCTK